MLILGTLIMGFWLTLVGGLQARFGAWGDVDGSRTSPTPLLLCIYIELMRIDRCVGHH